MEGHRKISGQKWNLSDQTVALSIILTSNIEPEVRYDRAKTNLVDHRDQRQLNSYF